MTEQEQKLKEMLETVEAAKDKLKKFTAQLRCYYDRLQDIAVQHRRKQPVTDLTFAEDFRATVTQLRAFTDVATQFFSKVQGLKRNQKLQLFEVRFHLYSDIV